MMDQARGFEGMTDAELQHIITKWMGGEDVSLTNGPSASRELQRRANHQGRIPAKPL